MVCFQWQQIRTDQQFGLMSQGTSITLVILAIVMSCGKWQLASCKKFLIWKRNLLTQFQNVISKYLIFNYFLLNKVICKE